MPPYFFSKGGGTERGMPWELGLTEYQVVIDIFDDADDNHDNSGVESGKNTNSTGIYTEG